MGNEKGQIGVFEILHKTVPTLQQFIYNCFVWADMSARNRILAIKVKSAVIVTQLPTVNKPKEYLGLADPL